MVAHEARREQRQSVTLRVRLRTPGGEIDTYTDDVSSGGVGVRLHNPPPLGSELSCSIHMPDGVPVRGLAVCRNVRPGGVTGFSFTADPEDAPHWNLFLEQEETAGSLWRLLGRYVESSDAPGGSLNSVIARGSFGQLARPSGYGAGNLGNDVPIAGQQNVVLRLHTVGDTGEAYRLAFEKHTSEAGVTSKLCQRLPGFAELAQVSVARVLKENVLLRVNANTPIFPARVVMLKRGGFAYVQRGEDNSCGLVSLCVGELILVAVDGYPIYPYFDDAELDRISNDVDVVETVPEGAAPHVPDVVANPLLDGPSLSEPVLHIESLPTEGVEAVRIAQTQAEQVQTRTYGERVIRLFPSVWAKAHDDDGYEVSGPTMEDGARICLLALRGPDAPRVVRLSDLSKPVLIEPQAKG